MADRGRFVTMTVPSDTVESRGSRQGSEYFLTRLPVGTVVDGQDLAGGLVCAPRALPCATGTAMTDVFLPANEPRTVLLPPSPGTSLRRRVPVDPETLRDAVDEANKESWEIALTEEATRLFRAGETERAHEVLGRILAGRGDSDPLPPRAPAPKQEAPTPGRNEILAYEALGILPAFHPLCSVPTRSPTATVPEHFTHVAFDRGHCVTREFFTTLLEAARSRPPKFGGMREEHSIHYVARQLAEPFLSERERDLAEINDTCVDFTSEVLVIPGARVTSAAEGIQERETIDLGVATLSVDKLYLMSQCGMSLRQADEEVARLHRQLEDSVSIMVDRIGIDHVSALLRSPEAMDVLLEAGIRLENPVTGEWAVAGEPGMVDCHLVGLAKGIEATADPSELMEWCRLHVVMDEGWRIDPQDALPIAFDESGPMAALRERARSAYRTDPWLTERERAENATAREGTTRLYSGRISPIMDRREHPQRDGLRHIRIDRNAADVASNAPTRVA